ncbi:NAD(P)/FAD-dependent oxidoreductase [Parapedobacter koreensis]|uniref:D-amino-acid dehydrogenase n=1 Tax=Parapedobacter koreensis TaxID=332977 RepID=A0A1H7GEC1_9SPHI|nr:FAD-dependent oxidoreductase [Parapedobacter koreensis]SEK36471.1 D-amino-acid dehydrogenase [Parapedobacter koreensis]
MASPAKGTALIIGGGIIGLTSAYYLAKEGWKVTILDKGDFADNCSYGNAGMIVPSHFTPMAAPGIVAQGIKWMFNSRSPFYVKPTLSPSLISWGLKFLKHANEHHVKRSAPHLLSLNNLSKSLYDSLADELREDFGLAHRGILMLYKTEKTAEEEIHLAEQAKALGLDVAVLTRQAAQAIEPDVKLDVLGAVHYRSDAHLYPPALMHVLMERVKQLGATMVPHAEVVAMTRNNGKITEVTTTDDHFTADTVVLAGGAWLQGLAKKAGLAIPLMPGKGYSFMTDAFGGKVRHPALLLEARVALTPMGGNVRIGGTMELAAINHRINIRRVEGIVNALPEYYPEYRLAMPDEQAIWHGFRPCSPDGLPYLGRSRSISNLIIAGGMGMMGLSLGAAAGKIVSELAQHGKTSANIASFDPERFH